MTLRPPAPSWSERSRRTRHRLTLSVNRPTDRVAGSLRRACRRDPPLLPNLIRAGQRPGAGPTPLARDTLVAPFERIPVAPPRAAWKSSSVCRTPARVRLYLRDRDVPLRAQYPPQGARLRPRPEQDCRPAQRGPVRWRPRRRILGVSQRPLGGIQTQLCPEALSCHIM